MASVVKICNMALSHIGSEARVSDIAPPDGSVEAGYCEAFFDQARTELLEPGTWNFSLARAPLAEVTNLSTAWAYAYALPSDCMRALRILRPGAGLTVFNQDDVRFDPNDNDSAPFTVEGEVLYTNMPEAVVVYVRDVTDTTWFTPSFTAALGYLLASYLAGPVVKGAEGTRMGDAMRQRAMSITAMAAVAGANASNSVHDIVPDSIGVRA